MKKYFENAIDRLTDPCGTEIDFTFSDLKYYPKYLYKYRDCGKEYAFQTIEDEYLWAAVPAEFCDPSDALVHLKLKSELPIIQKWIYRRLGEVLYYSIPPKGMKPYKGGHTLQSYIDAQGRFVDEFGKYDARKAKLLVIKEIHKLSPTERKKIREVFDFFESTEFEEKVQNGIKTTLENVVDGLRKRCMVCCLTERKDNQKMWEEYADKYSGFVVEYDLSKTCDHTECLSVISHMFPVTYYKRMPKVPLLPFVEKAFIKALYGRNVSIADTERKLLKQLLIKKSDYCSEEEWRIVSSKQKVEFPLVSAVYAGYKISDENIKRLKSICGEKGITLCKQRFSVVGDMVFDLVSV